MKPEELDKQIGGVETTVQAEEQKLKAFVANLASKKETTKKALDDATKKAEDVSVKLAADLKKVEELKAAAAKNFDAATEPKSKAKLGKEKDTLEKKAADLKAKQPKQAEAAKSKVATFASKYEAYVKTMPEQEAKMKAKTTETIDKLRKSVPLMKAVRAEL